MVWEYKVQTHPKLSIWWINTSRARCILQIKIFENSFSCSWIQRLVKAMEKNPHTPKEHLRFWYKVDVAQTSNLNVWKLSREEEEEEEDVKYHEQIEWPKSFHVSAFIHKFKTWRKISNFNEHKIHKSHEILFESLLIRFHTNYVVLNVNKWRFKSRKNNQKPKSLKLLRLTGYAWCGNRENWKEEGNVECLPEEKSSWGRA